MNWGSNKAVSEYFKNICLLYKKADISFIEASADLAIPELLRKRNDQYPVLWLDSIDTDYLPNQVKDLIENPNVVFSIVDLVNQNSQNKSEEIIQAWEKTKSISESIIKRIEREIRNTPWIRINKIKSYQISSTALHYGTISEINFQLGPIEFNKEDWEDGYTL